MSSRPPGRQGEPWRHKERVSTSSRGIGTSRRRPRRSVTGDRAGPRPATRTGRRGPPPPPGTSRARKNFSTRSRRCTSSSMPVTSTSRRTRTRRRCCSANFPSTEEEPPDRERPGGSADRRGGLRHRRCAPRLGSPPPLSQGVRRRGRHGAVPRTDLHPRMARAARPGGEHRRFVCPTGGGPPRAR